VTDRTEDEPIDLTLPALEADEEGEGVGDAAPLELELVDSGNDPFDDSNADDLPIEIQLATDQDLPTAVGDDAVGVERSSGDDGVRIDESAASLIDEGRGHAEEGLVAHGDDELGIDPIPREIDDGGAEGLDDPAGSHVDPAEFPPMDGDEDDDDDEIDVGIEIAPPPQRPID
jgi:hypothetical protein